LSAETIVRNVRFPSFPAAEEELAGAPAYPNALEEAARAREAARNEGLVCGREEGREAALAEWAPRLASLAAALEQTIAVARAERERLAAEITRAVPEAAVTIARKVIEQELTDGEAALRTALHPIVRRLVEGDVAAVRVAPDVAEALRAWLDASEQRAALAGVTIHADETLDRGDWIIETASGFLDGRLATQLAEARRLLAEPDA
jgi:flagellar biosynthesis/type III secretory pathway protein FliH